MTKSSELLAAFAAWAARRRRVYNLAVLSAVLAAHDACATEVSGPDAAGAARTSEGMLTWRAGEAYDAVVSAAATESAVLLAGTDVVRETLDSFFRFLRNTGRLRTGSADVVALRKECCRAVDLVERAVEGARLLWPLVSEQLECPDEEDEDDWLHPDDPRYRTRNLLRDLGLRGAATVPLPSVERAATQGVTSSYMTLLFRLTGLIADDVIRPRSSFPEADEAASFAEALGLADVDAFEDLWLAGMLSGLLRGSHDAPVPPMTRAEFDGLPVEGRLMRACEVGQSRIRRLRYEETGSGAIALIVWSLMQGGGWVSLANAAEVGAREDYWYEDDRLTLAAAELDTCLEALADAGVVEREPGRARLTDFGMWAADLWVEDVFEGP